MMKKNAICKSITSLLMLTSSMAFASGGTPAVTSSQVTQSSEYVFQEFNWGSNTNESINVCASGTCLIEGDQFSTQNGLRFYPAPKDKLTVLSYNVLRPSSERIQNQINWIKGKFGEQGPDLIFLSEVVRGNGCGAGRNTAREYAKAFNAYYVYGNEDGVSSSCQTGNAIVSRYPLGNVVLKRFNTQHGDSSSSPTATGRSFIAADVNVAGNIIHAYSTHTASPFGVEGDNARKAQHAEMVAHAQNKPFTRILGGDLNAIGHIFADPLGLHDISLNPIFDANYKDAHDDLWTHERITSEAGLVDNDWTLLLDFIFVQAGTTSNAGVCQSECRNKATLSDHVPIWADVSYLKNGASMQLNKMRAGGSYNVMIQSTYQNCGLQWQGGNIGSGERNAKFDCASNPDPMIFEASANPTTDAAGNVSVAGYIRTRAGGHTCGLEWDGSISGGERNAKFDCGNRADPLVIRSLSGASGARVHITSNQCGLQWDGSIDNGERNAKWDCDPAYDDLRVIDVGGFHQLQDARSGRCLSIAGGQTTYGAAIQLASCTGASHQSWMYEAQTGFLRSEANPDWCLDNRGQTYNGGQLTVHPCVDHNNLRWDFVANSLRSRNNNSIAIDAYGSAEGTTIGQWTFHGGSNQRWNWID